MGPHLSSSRDEAAVPATNTIPWAGVICAATGPSPHQHVRSCEGNAPRLGLAALTSVVLKVLVRNNQ